ncbi:MAG: T9SS type A sorting domain-containing protein [Saprospiraceae bacterium]|nr:T9SS type A sorting domain-containing protein [Saprospiraceae bacterium]
MKNLITFLLYCLSVTALIAQARQSSQIDVLSDTGTETVLQVTLSGAGQLEVQTPSGPAQIPVFEGGTPLLEKGAPDVPKLATCLRIPNRGKMAVEILSADYDEFSQVNIAPSKGNLKRTTDPATLPYEYGPAYQQNQFYPGRMADLQQPFIFRDTRGQALWLYPVQYNPVKKILRVYRSMTIRVYATAEAGENERNGGPLAQDSRAFASLYRQLFVNGTPRISSRGGSDSPDEMLILAKDELLPALQPLVDWKRQMGIHTTVVPVSAVGSSESGEVYNFVKNYYAQHPISYLLLVGDEDAIRPEMRQDGDFYSCDNCFGYLDGQDHFPEVLVGRLHASTPEQVSIMVNRNLEYEKYPLADSTQNWCATGMASASNEGAGFGDDNQADWQHGNEWKTAHLADGFEQYWEFYDGSHGPDSPTPGSATADQDGNPSNAPLVDLMNTRGVSLYNYTGHGWEQGLVSGNFNTNAVAQLRNPHRYPILIAVACCAGNFTNGECLGEAWQRAGDPASGEAWGGIGGFFSSDYQSWSPPMEGQDGMNQYLADADGLTLSPTLAGMLAIGNAKMISAYGGNGELMADFWNPFAEPSTVPRTRLPLALSASHVAELPFGASSLHVDCPVEGALVSLFWQNQTWAVGTIQNGSVDLEFSPLENTGELVVTVSQFNHIPYQGKVGLLPAAPPFLLVQQIELDDAAGNQDKKADFGETVSLQIKIKNAGMATAVAPLARLSVLSPYVTLLNDEVLLADLQGADTSSVVFSFAVDAAVPNGQGVTFALLLRYNDSLSVSTSIPLQLQAPTLEVGAWSLDDSDGGNGNGYLESGETALLRILNRNNGGSTSLPATGSLSTASPYLLISSANPLGALPALGGEQEAVFSLSLTPDAPASAAVELLYQLEAGAYSAQATISPLILNPVLETFESHTFDAWDWEMSGNKPWVISSSGAYAGQFCSRSGVITHNQSSAMTLNLFVSEAGWISFARKVSSEADFDFLRFYIDGQQVAAWSGSVAWGIEAFPVAAGVHTFAWVYQKDDLKSEGSDRAWVDEIILPPHQIIVAAPEAPALAPLQLTVAPNPTSGIAQISLELPDEQALSVQLFDCLGRVVQTIQPAGTRSPAGTWNRQADLRHCPPGVYWLRVQSAGATHCVKLEKM